MTDKNSGNPVSKKRETLLTPKRQRGGERLGTHTAEDDRISCFQKRRTKIGNAKAAQETELTIEEVCSILERENQEAMQIAVEAWDKLLQVRLSLIAMRGNLNQGDLEQIIKDIGTTVSPFPGVNLEGDE